MTTPNKIQPSFAGGELAPSLHARVDLAKYATGLRTATNVFIHAHGGASNRTGFQFIAEVKDSSKTTRLVPFQFNTTQTYILELGHLYMRVYKTAGQVLTSGVSAWVTATAYVVGDLRTNGGTTYYCTTAHTSGTFATDLAAGKWYAQTGAIYEIPTPYSSTDLALLKFAQSADTMYLVHPSYAPRKLTRSGHTNWKLSDITFAPSISAPGSVTATPATGGATAYNYVATAVKSESLEESLASSTATANSATLSSSNYVTISWAAVSGAEKYNVYREKNGIYGWVGSTETTTFKDDNIDPDTTDTPQKARNPFASSGDYPGTVTFHQQRLTFASSNNKPQTFWMSQSANYENYCVSSPTKDNDAVTFTIAARQVNEIRHLVPLKDLLAMTSGGEWLIAAGNQTDVITPGSISVKPQGYRGSAHVPPLVVGDTILFVQEKGSIVRDLGYKLDVDGYTGNDLSVLSNHLFDGYTISEWAYAQSPYSLIWAVRSDGTLLSLTYMREHEVWAWAKHTTSGTFESIATIGEGSEDAVYVIVNRTINGSTKRYVERLHSRSFTNVEDAFFVDSGLTYSGAAATTISGLDHLEGKEVVALSNGNVVTGLTVSGGNVILPRSTTKAHIGLAYTGVIETLNIDLGAMQTGSAQGRRKRITQVDMRVEKTRGVWVGPDVDNLVELKQRSTEAWSDPTALATGDIDIDIPPVWDTAGRVYIQQPYPLPMTVLAVIPRFNIGD